MTKSVALVTQTSTEFSGSKGNSKSKKLTKNVANLSMMISATIAVKRDTGVLNYKNPGKISPLEVPIFLFLEQKQKLAKLVWSSWQPAEKCLSVYYWTVLHPAT